MADEAQLELIRQGVEVWNRWRRDNPQVVPNLGEADLVETNLSLADLSGSYLRGAVLSGANLRGAYLRGADMSWADLRSTDLNRADLIKANLIGADFSQANLCGADLSRADLIEADLSQAYLSRSYLRRVHLLRADLNKANLSGADLSRADLRGADLNGTDFNQAQLTGADLTGANLRRANLNSASLIGANFVVADLTKADFREASLYGAILSRVNLEGVDLSRARIGLTTFASTDLSVVKGLESVTHDSPSTIGADTLLLSHGQIPKAFLRGCGLSDWQIEASGLHQPDLTNEELGNILYKIHDLRVHQPIQINPLFISYTHRDGDFVNELERHLVNDGIRFWRDVHHSTAGRLERQVDRAIRLNPTVLLVLSENSVRSDWVQHEARLARELEKDLRRDVLCPIALDGSWEDCGWPERLLEQIKEYKILDFSNWQDRTHFTRVYKSLVEGLDLFYRKKDE